MGEREGERERERSSVGSEEEDARADQDELWQRSMEGIMARRCKCDLVQYRSRWSSQM